MQRIFRFEKKGNSWIELEPTERPNTKRENKEEVVDYRLNYDEGIERYIDELFGEETVFVLNKTTLS
jgi:hypothetical protein